MANTRKPRSGSMQVWPRKRARRQYPRVRSWAISNEKKALGFAGYKVGMTHVIHIDNAKTSRTKGEEIFCPCTVIECPALKVAAIRLYSSTPYGLQPKTQFFSKILEKNLIERKLLKSTKQNEENLAKISINDFDDLRLVVYTQPDAIGLKKRPELFEIALGSSKDDKLVYAKEKLGKEITIKDVFSEGNQVDIHSVTKGKGLQGPVKRYGISLKSHKSEKSRRASVLAPEGYAKVSSYAHQSGQMGYHTRTEHNKKILKIGDNGNDIKMKGGFLRYGNVKNNYIVLKGSVGGPRKRLIRFNLATRPNKKFTKEAPQITYTSLNSKQ